MSLMMFLLAFFYKCKHLTRLYTSPSPLRGLLSFENAIWKPIPTFPIGKELKQQISSLKCKQMVSPFSLEGDGGGYIFSKKMIGFSLMSLWCRLLKTCFHKDGSIKSLKEQNALIIFIFFWLWTILQSIFKLLTQDFAGDPFFLFITECRNAWLKPSLLNIE